MAKYMDLDPKRFGLAFGIVGGIWLLILALMGNVTWVSLYASLFKGYNIGGIGAIYGLIYGIIVGGIFGYLFAYTHNYLKGKIK